MNSYRRSCWSNWPPPTVLHLATPSFIWYKNLDRSFFRFLTSQFTRVTDGQIDRRTGRILIAIPRLYYMQRGKNDASSYTRISLCTVWWLSQLLSVWFHLVLTTQTHHCLVHLLQTFINSNEQNNLAKIVLNNSAITAAIALQQLHWLPIKQRIHFKIATVTYRILQTGSPAYLSPFINLNTPSRTLRSASHNFLHVPFTSTAVGRKAFRYAAPTVWNSIPFNIRHSPSIGSFKRHLKTFFFYPRRLVMFST